MSAGENPVDALTETWREKIEEARRERAAFEEQWIGSLKAALSHTEGATAPDPPKGSA